MCLKLYIYKKKKTFWCVVIIKVLVEKASKALGFLTGQRPQRIRYTSSDDVQTGILHTPGITFRDNLRQKRLKSPKARLPFPAILCKPVMVSVRSWSWVFLSSRTRAGTPSQFLMAILLSGSLPYEMFFSAPQAA